MSGKCFNRRENATQNPNRHCTSEKDFPKIKESNKKKSLEIPLKHNEEGRIRKPSQEILREGDIVESSERAKYQADL